MSYDASSPEPAPLGRLDLQNKKPGRLWPWIKTVAKAVKIPGTELTLGALAELQDQLAADEAQKTAGEAQKKRDEALDALVVHSAEIVRLLGDQGVKLSEEDLADAAEEIRQEIRPPVLGLWNVPHRNPYFTGRDDLLDHLHSALTDDGRAVLGQAISGLGGIGKTQTAIEYCHRHRDAYPRGVFWIRAQTDPETRGGFVSVARFLSLPEAEAQEQDVAVGAVLRWLSENDGWLLVFDNADRPAELKAFLPHDVRGRVLLTSRASKFGVLGIREPFRINTLPAAEAHSFLLDRAERQDASEEERTAVAELAKQLGCLPLALEQAGAYVAASEARFRTYLESYRKRHLSLLEEAGPETGVPRSSGRLSRKRWGTTRWLLPRCWRPFSNTLSSSAMSRRGR